MRRPGSEDPIGVSGNIINNQEDDPEYQQVSTMAPYHTIYTVHQIIRVGTCAATRECRGAWPGQVTQCRQLYLDHKLVVMTRTGEVVLDHFSFHSCCLCHVLNLQPRGQTLQGGKKRPGKMYVEQHCFQH